MNTKLKEQLETFYQSNAAKLTVKELLTSSSNVALPTMVQAAAMLEMGIWTDARDFGLNFPVPNGAGKTVDVQILTAPEYQTISTDSTVTTAGVNAAVNYIDPAATKGTITLAPIVQATPIDDLLANTSAVNFIQQFGKLHGASMRKGIYNGLVDAMITGKGNTTQVTTATKLTLPDVVTAINLNSDDGFISDFITCKPADMWNAFTTDYAITQFSGALHDMMTTGAHPNVFGLQWYPDPYFTTAAAAKTMAVVGSKQLSGAYAQLQSEPVVEIYREPLKLMNTVVTHIDFGACAGVANSIATITTA